MLKILILFALVILAGVISINDAFAELDLADKKLTSASNNSEFEFIFSDGIVSGHLTVENQLITFENPTVIVKNNIFRIFDKHNDVRILGKQVGAEKYLIIFKINSDDIQTKLRFIANSNDLKDTIKNAIKNTSQRDLLQEIQNKLEKNETKNMTAKELQLMEKQKKLDDSLKKSDKKIQRIVEKQKNLKTSNSILERVNAYKKSIGITIDNKKDIPSTPAKEPVTQTILPGSKVNVLVSQYDRVTKGNSYVFQVKTFDVKKYSGTDWSKFEGKLDGVNISAQIIAPDGQVKEKFSGLTKYGMFEGSIPVKDDRFWPQGKYTLIINSEFQGDKTSKTLKFFVVEAGSTSTSTSTNKSVSLIESLGLSDSVVHTP